MQAFDIGELKSKLDNSGKLYLEFLRAPSLSMGLYELEAGQEDPQQPHNEDEVYYVVAGRGRLRVGENDQSVAPGSIVFVPAKVPHRFHSTAEDLSVLVFFAPAESV